MASPQEKYTEITDAPEKSVAPESIELPEKLWMARLYVLRRKAERASQEASKYDETLHYENPSWDMEKAWEIAEEVEQGFMDKPNFEELKKTPKYQKLVEAFAIAISKKLLKDFDLKDTFGMAVKERGAWIKHGELSEKADQVAEEHSSLEDIFGYLAFSVKAFVREMAVKPLHYEKMKIPRGFLQMVDEMKALSKKKGKYRKHVMGLDFGVEEMTRLAALAERTTSQVEPVGTTPPFLNKGSQLDPYLQQTEDAIKQTLSQKRPRFSEK